MGNCLIIGVRMAEIGIPVYLWEPYCKPLSDLHLCQVQASTPAFALSNAQIHSEGRACHLKSQNSWSGIHFFDNKQCRKPATKTRHNVLGKCHVHLLFGIDSRYSCNFILEKNCILLQHKKHCCCLKKSSISTAKLVNQFIVCDFLTSLKVRKSLIAETQKITRSKRNYMSWVVDWSVGGSFTTCCKTRVNIVEEAEYH